MFWVHQFHLFAFITTKPYAIAYNIHCARTEYIVIAQCTHSLGLLCNIELKRYSINVRAFRTTNFHTLLPFIAEPHLTFYQCGMWHPFTSADFQIVNGINCLVINVCRWYEHLNRNLVIDMTLYCVLVPSQSIGCIDFSLTLYIVRKFNGIISHRFRPIMTVPCSIAAERITWQPWLLNILKKTTISFISNTIQWINIFYIFISISHFHWKYAYIEYNVLVSRWIDFIYSNSIHHLNLRCCFSLSKCTIFIVLSLCIQWLKLGVQKFTL